MPTTKQPVWKFIGNLGDVNPLDYDGYFIYKDTTGVYPEEAEVLERATEDDEKSRYTIYRFSLDRLKLVAGYLVPLHYSSTWPLKAYEQRGVLDWMPSDAVDVEHAQRYAEWFQEHLPEISSHSGITKEELELAFTSEDPLVRAEAYREIGMYHGWHELDHDPLTGLSRAEVKKRYRSVLNKL